MARIADKVIGIPIGEARASSTLHISGASWYMNTLWTVGLGSPFYVRGPRTLSCIVGSGAVLAPSYRAAMAYTLVP